MLAKINEQIEKFATENNGTVIVVNDSLEDDVCGWDDYRHYSEVLCAKVLQAIDHTYPEDGQKFLRIGHNPTSTKPYKKVLRSYKPGCSRCTVLGHAEDVCKNKTGVKRPVSTSSLSSHSKSQKQL